MSLNVCCLHDRAKKEEREGSVTQDIEGGEVHIERKGYMHHYNLDWG